jgi:hypothetical protein
MAQLDLDRLRAVVLEGRRGKDEPAPAARRRVFVTPGGRVVIEEDLPDGEERSLSEVHPAVFA